MKKQNIDFGEALRLLAQRAGVTIPSRFEPQAEEKEKERLFQVNEAAAQYFHDLLLSSPAGKKARDYVATRGLSLETITNFQLGFSPNKWEALKQHLLEIGYAESVLLEAGLIVETEKGKKHDRFRNRLMFPIHDIKGRTIGFGARALDDSRPKYLNSPQTPTFDKSRSLYGINLAAQAIRQQDLAVIVEGYTDVITAHQNGFNNVVASMGTAVTEKQISTLKRLTKDMVFALDADAAGAEALLRVQETSTEALGKDRIPIRYRDPNIPLEEIPTDEVQVLKDLKYRTIISYAGIPDIEVKVLVLPKGKDPDDIIKDDAKNWRHLLEDAIPVVDHTIDSVTSKLDLTTAKGKSSAVDELLPVIFEIKDPIRKEHYLQKLASLVKVSERSLETALSRIKPGRRAREPREEVAAPVVRPLLAEPIEEDCLALLLQHPELKEHCQELSPEYFPGTATREIFLAYQRAKEVKLIKRKLDSAFHEYIDYLMRKEVPANKLELRLADYVLRLREKYLRSLQDKNTEALRLAAESEGPAAELAKLEEQGTEISTQLGEVFAQKRQTGSGAKGVEK
jgi:DNA primase